MVTYDDLQPVDQALQNKMNQPPVDPDGFAPETEAFIRDVMSKVFSGEINVYQAETLLNQEAYQSASDELQGKADLVSISFCTKLREIKSLMDMSGGEQMFVNPTYQLNLLVQELKYRKEEFENQYGDLLII
jgi:hypothetical protein